jgi:D-alanyl-D-alanine carboxypeptidase
MLDRNARGRWINRASATLLVAEAAIILIVMNPGFLGSIHFDVNIKLPARPTARAVAAASGGAVGSPTPTPTVTASLLPTAPPKPLVTPPPCTYGDVPVVHGGYTDWKDTLVDTTYDLGAAYIPPDLVSVDQAGMSGTGYVRSLVIDDLHALWSAARDAGVDISVTSAYRSYTDQEAVFKETEASYGTVDALRIAARPGHSEHQLGTTIDFFGGQAWLVAFAWTFGFVMSYPAGSSPDVTCYALETWHYRYYGRDRAAAIHISGLTTREWLWAYEQK